MNSPLHKLKTSSKTRTTTLHKTFLAAGLLSGAALASIVFVAPAKADSCVAAGMTVAMVVTSGFTCTAGDKLYSDFSYSGLDLGDQVSIAAGIPNHTISVQNASGWGIGTYSLKYKIAVIGGSGGPGSYNPYLRAYSVSSSSSIFDPDLPAGTFSVNSSNLGLPDLSVAVNGGLGGPKFYPVKAFDSDTFTLTLDVTQGKVTSFDQTVTQSAFMSEVPGPLPLLGAGAAFGFSRRIRSRIKASA